MRHMSTSLSVRAAALAVTKGGRKFCRWAPMKPDARGGIYQTKVSTTPSYRNLGGGGVLLQSLRDLQRERDMTPLSVL